MSLIYYCCFQLKWSVYITSTNKSYKLKISEDTESFSDAIADGHLVSRQLYLTYITSPFFQTHPDLYTTITLSSPVTLDLVNKTSPQHVHTVHQLLMATRPLVATC